MSAVPRYSHRSTPSIRKPSVARPRRAHNSSSPFLPPPLLFTLRIAVVLLVFWYEYGTFWHAARDCRWDDSPSELGVLTGGEKDSRWLASAAGEGTEGGDGPFHALVVADPQLLDMRSYPGRNWFLRWLGVRVTDAYARRAWRFVIGSRGSNGKGAHGVVWLGDLMDGGVDSVDRKEHTAYVHRFHLLFPLPRAPSASNPHLAPPIPSILLPGNHDLGLHLPSSSLASYARERFEESFGPVSGEKEWGGWNLVWIDSMGLLEEEGRAARGFVESIAERPITLPRVLLSHIPLYRPDDTPCGQAREHHRAIYQGTGKNYQNELDQTTSDWLLRSLNPTLVYSGDDHDACVVEHQPPPGPAQSAVSSIRETTVKAFSMAMGVRQPGYHLLSLYPSLPSPADPTSSLATFTQTNCVLPDQLSIWLSIYLPAIILLTLSILLPKLYLVVRRDITRRRSASARANGLPVHSHRRSLSRKLFSPAMGPGDLSSPLEEEEDEDGDEQFPTFPFPFGSGGGMGGYASPMGEDELPSAYVPEGAEGRVRRVSRVWAWEKEDGSPASGGGGGGGFAGLRGAGGGRRGDGYDWLPFAYLLGPVNWWGVRPVTRLVRSGWRKLWGRRRTGVLGWLGGWVAGRTVRETVREVWRVVWMGVGVWVAVQVWFWL